MTCPFLLHDCVYSDWNLCYKDFAVTFCTYVLGITMTQTQLWISTTLLQMFDLTENAEICPTALL
jgi:hypothetical protein